MNIIERVKKLNFPQDEYVVVGGVMEVFGIRSARDVDIVASKKLFKELSKDETWKRKMFFRGGFFNNRKALQKGDVEVFSNFHHKKFKIIVGEHIHFNEDCDDSPKAMLGKRGRVGEKAKKAPR